MVMNSKLKHFVATAMGAGILALFIGVAGAQAQPAAANAPVAKGQKIVMATHSFNVFISTDPDRAPPTRTQVVAPGGAAAPAPAAGARPAGPCAAPYAPTPAVGVPLLTKLTNEAGITGQEFLAVQMIGGSTPMQHWNQCDGDESKNIAKAAQIGRAHV